MPGYVGRASYVDEYIGATVERLAVRFVPPESVGLDATRLGAERGQIAICARGGPQKTPNVSTAWLIQHVRATVDGCEMRSRFWIGGPYVEMTLGSVLLGRLAAFAIRRAVRPTRDSAAALLVHCAEEMNHLAALLPARFAIFGPRGPAAPR